VALIIGSQAWTMQSHPVHFIRSCAIDSFAMRPCPPELQLLEGAATKSPTELIVALSCGS